MSSSYEDSNNKKTKETWSAYTAPSYKKPKTKIRISLPEGSERVSLLKMAEVNAPGGVEITFTLPFPMSEAGLDKIVESIKSVGGTLEIMD